MTTPSAPTPEPLPANIASLLTEFARACRAATRIVSMYPSSHPAIQSALARITETSRQAMADGPLVFSVLPDNLMVMGRTIAKPEAAVAELAGMLHQQLVAEVTMRQPLNNSEWHAFLSLLAKSAEDARALGGIANAWAATGSKAIALKEIDYADVLRERGGISAEVATWARIIASFGDEEAAKADTPMGAILTLARNPAKLAQFAHRLQEEGRAAGDDSAQQRRSLLELMHGLANYAAERTPEELDGVLNRMAGAAAQMSPSMLLSLITDPPPMPPGGAPGPRMDLAGELQARLTDEMISKFLVDNVMSDRGASNRLAAAFHTLVPDPERQQNILAAATEQATAMFADDPQFQSVWSSSTEMLMKYSDAEYVSDSYARELTAARTQAVEIEKIGEDPPARIRAWTSTLSEEEMRALDQRLLLDLLTIETRPEAWAGVLDLAVTAIENLVLAGDLTLASKLVDRIVEVSRHEASPFHASAVVGVSRLGEGPFVRHLTTFLRQATDSEVGIANQMCRMIGPVLVGPLADALASEDNARTVRRLRDILIGYGVAARRYADELRSSPNAAVRRAAVELLRALGGEEALPDLRTLLDDSDAQVQRQALRAIVQIGSNEAYQALERALQGGKPHTREAIMQSLGALRDERAAPLFVYILTHSGHTGELESVYVQSIESLGRVAADEKSVSTLKDILYRGEWYAPKRTARIRAAAARALRAIALPTAERTLQEAVNDGPGGVRRAAKAALAEPAPVRTNIRKAT